MKRILVFINRDGLETAWKDKGDPDEYEIIAVDLDQETVKIDHATATPDYFTDMDDFIASYVEGFD